MPDSLFDFTEAAPPQQDAGLPVDQPYRGANLGPLQGANSGVIGNTPVAVAAAPPDVVQALDNRPEPNVVGKIIKRLVGEQESPRDISGPEPLVVGEGATSDRYQLWPEKVVREALAAPHDAIEQGVLPAGLRREDYTDIPAPTMPTNDSTWLGQKLGIAPVAASPADTVIGQAQAVSALAGSGGLAGTTDATLGATPFLRPALKYGDKIYKAPAGGQHLDALPAHLADTFQKQALSGEDISNFNFGFMNHKGQFLDREKALDYAVKEGLVDPSAGQYGALTSTLLADSSKPGTAIEAMAKTGQPFYSALEHNVSQISQSKMTGDQWLGTLANKPGVKPEEMDWTGVKDFLKERGGSTVTKAELQEHLANNKVELKEVNKGTGELKAAAEGLQKAVGNEPVAIKNHRDKLYPDEIEQGLWSGDITPKDLPTNLQPHAEKMLSLRHQQENPTKYHSYQLPGGENYREMLMTLPNYMKQYNEFADSLGKKYGAKVPFSKMPLTDVEKSRLEFLQNRGEDPTYKSSHWDEPNILAHVRMNDRVIDGKKSLHVEEIQSDWHQQGREKGYKSNVDKLDVDYRKALAEASKLKADDPNFSKMHDKADSLLNELSAAKNGVPDAPFKKTWHELALKRMIREAAEKGYDRLSWTPGEAQAARYDLSKSISDVELHGTGDNMRLSATDKNGRKVIDMQHVTDKTLPDRIGKEAAEKLLAQKEPDPKNPYGARRLNNQDLKIGGEGMKGFYDQIIPKALSKISGEKVKTTNLPHERMSVQPGYKEKSWDVVSADGTGIKKFETKAEADAYVKERGQPIHYIDIPQALKDKAMQKGFPLFSGNYMYTPVSGNPFETEKKKSK